jgi:hypothetical protein
MRRAAFIRLTFHDDTTGRDMAVGEFHHPKVNSWLTSGLQTELIFY